MAVTIHDFPYQELDAIIDYSLYQQSGGRGWIVDPYIIAREKIVDNTPGYVSSALEAISRFHKELLERGHELYGDKEGYDYIPGPFLQTFRQRGGFKKIHDDYELEHQKSTAERDTQHQANLATVDAAKSAKQAWIWAAVSTGISVIALLISIFKK